MNLFLRSVRAPRLLAPVLLSLLFATACPAQRAQPAAATTQQKLAALKQARDSGALTEQEYETKVAALKGSAPAAASPSPASSSSPASRSTTDHHTWHMKRAEWNGSIGLDAIPQFNLPATPHKNITIVSMLIPSDWTFQAANGAPQQADCNFDSGRLTLLALSPDKKSVFLAKPAYDSVWSSDRNLLQSIAADNRQFVQNQNCVIRQPQPLSSEIPAMLKALIPTAVVTGAMEHIPGLSDQLGSMLDKANRGLAQEAAGTGHPVAHVAAEAGRLHFTNTDKDGTAEGFLYVLKTERTDPLPSGGTLVTTDFPMQFLAGAPLGQLAAAEPMVQAMAGSIQISPEYLAECAQTAANRLQIREITKQRLQQIAANIAADNAHAAAQQSAIMSGLSSYRNQVMSNVAANRSAALEHSSQQFSLYMGDQAIYKDSATGHSVQLPSGANHVWASTTGNTNDYILTDSPSYNPNGQAGSASWTQMQMQH